jgi:hypothetical protein
MIYKHDLQRGDDVVVGISYGGHYVEYQMKVFRANRHGRVELVTGVNTPVGERDLCIRTRRTAMQPGEKGYVLSYHDCETLLRPRKQENP